MKKRIFLIVFIIIGVVLMSKAQSIYSGARNILPQPPSEIATSNAYTLSVLDIDHSISLEPSFIHIYTTYNATRMGHDINFRRIGPCLDQYSQGSGAYLTLPYMPNSTTVYDVIESDLNYFDIYFCGSSGRQVLAPSTYTSQGMIGKIDAKFTNPSVFFYPEMMEFYSIIQVNEFFIACGKRYNPSTTGYKGGIMVLRDDFTPISFFETEAVLTEVVHDERYGENIFFCGYEEKTIHVFTSNIGNLLDPNNPHIADFSFTYELLGVDMTWDQKDEKNIHIKILEGERIAVGATGYLWNSTTNSVCIGIFHINSFDGMNPISVNFALPANEFYLKEMDTFDYESFYMLFHERDQNYGFFNPLHGRTLLMHIEPNARRWNAIENRAAVDRYISSFKRIDCKRFEVASSSSSAGNPVTNFYSQIELPLRVTHPGVEAALVINYTPNNFNIATPPQPVPNPAGLNFLPLTYQYMNNGIFNRVGAIYSGACAQYCKRSAIVESQEQEMEKEVLSSVLINYDNIIFSDIDMYDKYEIYDIMGRKIISSNVDKTIIPISSIPTGTYILRLQKQSGEIENHKFIR